MALYLNIKAVTAVYFIFPLCFLETHFIYTIPVKKPACNPIAARPNGMWVNDHERR